MLHAVLQETNALNALLTGPKEKGSHCYSFDIWHRPEHVLANLLGLV